MKKELTQQQIKRLEKLADIMDKGNIGILEYLFEIEEKIPAITEIISRLKGEKGDKPTRGELEEIIIPLLPKAIKGDKGNDGYDYVLTEKDKKDIAQKIIPPIVEKVIEKTEVIKEIPVVKETIIKVQDETPEQIVDKLESLEGNDRLDKRAIKGLDDIERDVEELKRGRQTIYVGGMAGGGGGGGRIVKTYDLSSSLNGVLKTFSLPAFWRVISIMSSSFPYTFRPTIDYTTDGGAMTITFTSEIEASTTLATGQTLLVTYAE